MEYGLAYVDGDGEVWLGLFKDGKIDEFSSIDVEEKDFVSGLLPTEFAIIKIESKGADSTFAKLGTLKLQHNGKSEAIYKQDKEQILKLANAFYPTVRQKVDEKYSS